FLDGRSAPGLPLLLRRPRRGGQSRHRSLRSERRSEPAAADLPPRRAVRPRLSNLHRFAALGNGGKVGLVSCHSELNELRDWLSFAAHARHAAELMLYAHFGDI